MFETLKNKLKSTHFVENYSRMLPYIYPYWGRALIAVLITIPIGGMDAVIAWSLKPYMDVVMVEKNTASTWYIPVLIVVFSCLQSGFSYMATYLNTWVGRKIANDVKVDLFDKLMHFDAGFFDKNTSGNIIFRFNNDVDSACNGLLNNMKLFTTRLFSSLSLIGVLFYNSWQLAIIAVVVLLGALYPLTTVRRRIKSIMDKTVFSGSAVVTHYNETFNGNRIISSYNLYDYQNARFQETLRSVFGLGMKMIQRTGMLSPMMHFVVSLGIAAVIWTGSHLIVTHQITSGNFVSFIAALIMLYNPIKSIGNNYNNIQLSFMAMERVFSALDSKPQICNRDGAVELKGVKQGIEYKDVCFEYVKDKPVLKHVNLSVNVGQTIAFVGNSGGGKTTMVNLLPRFYDVISGSVLIDGKDVRDLTLKSLRNQIGMVQQDVYLFDGTIRENIAYGKPDATDEEIKEAARRANMDDFIMQLPEQYDTYVGEKGTRLSGGQKQRISIARVFLKNPPILILDEATSALDNESERYIQKSLEELAKNRTTITIAHRLSTIKRSDEIIVITEDGIAERGTHETLLAKNGIYARYYNL